MTDPFLIWQLANNAARCERMSAIITIAVCEDNRNKSSLDCRCNGCNGLKNQTPAPLFEYSLVAHKIDEQKECVIEKNGFAELDKIIDGAARQGRIIKRV